MMISRAEGARSHLQKIEISLLRSVLADSSWLSKREEATFRWAFSMARLTKCFSDQEKNKESLKIDDLLERYRQKLCEILEPALDKSGKKIIKEAIKSCLGPVEKLAKNERESLLKTISNKISPQSLDEAIRKRPLSLTLSGGGGAAYVFVGALLALEEQKIIPSVISGSSMGSIIAAYRAKSKKFFIDELVDLVSSTRWNNIAEPFSGSSTFGIPATFKLDLREVVGEGFKKNSRYLRLRDLAIPLRVCVAGLSSAQPISESDLKKYAHLFYEEKYTDALLLKAKQPSVVSRIMEFAQKPLKAIYLGGDSLTKEFDVLDAVGFSSAIPGVFHYDIFRGDERMLELTKSLMIREGVSRLIDGGFVDNLPTIEAIRAIDEGIAFGFDPLVVGLDCFSPGLNRHWIFYPIMRFAMENSRAGHQLSQISVRFSKVLSPINFIPTKENFHYAIKSGYEEMVPHIELIKMALGPIPDPVWLTA